MTLSSLPACPVLHYDVSPGNVLVSPDGPGLLIDFGSALMGSRGEHCVAGTPLMGSGGEHCVPGTPLMGSGGEHCVPGTPLIGSGGEHCVAGTPLLSAVSVLWGEANTLSSDLEALFYTLLSIALDGEVSKGGNNEHSRMIDCARPRLCV